MSLSPSPDASGLHSRLVRILPSLAGVPFEVESTDLDGNAWNTRWVRRLRIRAADGRALECIEKKVAKVLGIAPFEALMQAQAARLDHPGALLRVAHLGTIDTLLASFLYSDVVSGPHAHLARVAASAGAGLAEKELASARLLAQGQGVPARLDFFRPWTRWRPRYSVALALRRGGLQGDPALRGILAIAQDMQPLLRSLGRHADRSARCFSHLDLLSKNLIDTGAGLYLIDWGEARVGRFGFDAGSYLHRLLRANDLASYGAARDVFLEAYFAGLPAGTDLARVRGNVAWFLALRTLCYFLRPDVLRQHRDAPQAVEEKLALLRADLQAAR